MINPVITIRHLEPFAIMTTAVLGALLLTACTITQKAPLEQSAVRCGLLVNECHKLQAGGKDQVNDRYFKSSAQWTQYDKVLIEPVTFWGGESIAVPAADQQALTNYFSQQLREQLGKKLQLADQAGPGVLKVTA